VFTDHEPTFEDCDVSAARFSVADCAWKQVLPDLPDDMIALLATPVVVCAEATKERSLAFSA